MAEKYKRLEKEVEEDIRKELEEQERIELEQREKELKELREKELKEKQERDQKLLEEGKEILTTVDIKIKADLKDSSDEEVDDYKTKFRTSAFNINSKYTNRKLVYKLNCRDKLNVYQGEVQRIKKRMGILTSKQQVYMCINRDRINLYKIPLTAVPIRQFLFDLEKISMDVDKTDKTVLRLNVNSKEYVFKLENEEKAKKWCNFVQKAIKKTIEEEGEAESSKTKTWKEPHISEKRFLREANTFDLLQFKANGVKTVGVVLQIIDKDSDYNLLYKIYPEILYLDPSTKMVTVRTFEELMSPSKVFFYPLLNFDCQNETLDAAQKLITDMVSI